MPSNSHHRIIPVLAGNLELKLHLPLLLEGGTTQCIKGFPHLSKGKYKSPDILDPANSTGTSQLMLWKLSCLVPSIKMNRSYTPWRCNIAVTPENYWKFALPKGEKSSNHHSFRDYIKLRGCRYIPTVNQGFGSTPLVYRVVLSSRSNGDDWSYKVAEICPKKTYQLSSQTFVRDIWPDTLLKLEYQVVFFRNSQHFTLCFAKLCTWSSQIHFEGQQNVFFASPCQNVRQVCTS